MVFIDSPTNPESQADFDWGEETIKVLDEWLADPAKNSGRPIFDWIKGGGRLPDTDPLKAT